VIDARGVQDLYTYCGDYLDPGKKFVSIGVAFREYSVSSMLYAVGLMLKNTWLPRALGGGSRDYVRISSFVSLEAMDKLKNVVEKGKIAIVVDSCWDMEEVLEVSMPLP
jgi:hypothetical protein